ncbi:MAG TPA: PrsW family intramembrane metalloprotease [Candidatus Limnocylindria bacterium]|nr:PrsW family intramembrane metalloprotease [Candidatus Limnocylindria bacterium]
MTCTNCGREGPEGRFCTWCGTRQGTDATLARRRFAAAPNESLVSPSLLTTFFPHLGERGVNEFRWALGAGLLVLLGLYVLGLITAAFIVAAILVPLVYLLYLYEARVYRDAPVPVTLGTMGGGFVVGIVATIVLDAMLGSRATGAGRVSSGVDFGVLILAAVAVPIIKEVVKPLPALLLRNRPMFGQSVDGLVFGIAAGLGFAAAETIIHFAAVITGLPAQTEPGLWFLPLATVAVLMPILHGTATGLITAALWRGKASARRLAGPPIAMAIGGHIAFAVGSQVVDSTGSSPVIAIIWQAIVVGAMLIAVRLLLDQLLRDEATAFSLSLTSCSNCGSEITAAGFCTVCGVALAATPHGGGPGPEVASSATGAAR